MAIPFPLNDTITINIQMIAIYTLGVHPTVDVSFRNQCEDGDQVPDY